MNAVLDFYYDVGSPNVYLASKTLKGVSERTGLIVKMHPVLIGGIFKETNNQPPWKAYLKIPAKFKYEQMEIVRYISEHKLHAFKMNTHFPVNTVLAMRAAIAAQHAGVHDSFFKPVINAMWEQSLDISKPGILTNVLNRAGLNGQALVTATQNDAVKLGLREATDACVKRGVFGLPAMFLGDEHYFGKDRVFQVERAVNRLRE